ncbi:hypothetical protein N9K47_00010 [bacterium]|nr:hypothetical protein [bacterium]
MTQQPEDGKVCPLLGMPFPLPKSGFYLQPSSAEHPQTAFRCQPDKACQNVLPNTLLSTLDSGQTGIVGALCTADICGDAVQVFYDIFEATAPGCSIGYAGDDCAQCMSTSTAKYFRNGKLCQPCPSNVLSPWTLLALGFFLFVAFLVFVSYFAGKVVTKAQVLNQLTTPLIILVTFGQTLSVVVDIDLKWPSFLLEIFSWFSFLTLKCVLVHCCIFYCASCGLIINMLGCCSLELGRPECSIEW